MRNSVAGMIIALMIIVGFVSSFAFGEAVTFRGNPQHTGVYEGTGVAKLSGIKWSFHTDGAVISSPAVVGGVVYFGSTDHYLYAVDAAAGTLKWKFTTQSRVTSSPAIADGMVYFESYDGNFYAVDAASGKERWRYQTGGERRYAAKHLHGSQPVAETMPDPFDVYLSSPAVVGGTVYFGSGDGNVYALDAGSGKLRWKFATGDVVHASPAVADGMVLIGSWDSYFYALDAGTGKQRWRFKTGDDPDTHNQVGIQSSAAVADGMVYFGCRDSTLYALSARTGEKKWAIDTKGSWVVGSPAVQAGKLYFSTSDSGLLYAVEAKTGTVVFSLNSKKWPMFSSPAIAGSTLIIGSNAGKLMAVDLGGQKITWEFETESSKKNGPQYTNADGTPKYEAAYFGDFYDDMVAGRDRLSSAVGPILSSPVVDGAVVYVGSSDGNLYALR
jgi:outer membrane protein assembly factor BamB